MIMKPLVKAQYIIGTDGRKKAVIIDLDQYRRLLEDYNDLRVIAHRKENVKVPALEFLNRLKRHGRL